MSGSCDFLRQLDYRVCFIAVLVLDLFLQVDAWRLSTDIHCFRHSRFCLAYCDLPSQGLHEWHASWASSRSYLTLSLGSTHGTHRLALCPATQLWAKSLLSKDRVQQLKRGWKSSRDTHNNNNFVYIAQLQTLESSQRYTRILESYKNK